MFAAYRQAYPELSKDWDAWISGELPTAWDADMPAFAPDKPLATRAASGKVLDAVSPRLFTLIGGSADLTPSNNTRPQSATDVQAGEYSGNYIRFGVREHGMGAILNGLALHGLRSYGGTFLVFSDYMRPAIRLAALMKLPVIYVFTHDSIGLGEDGPTHQPVEHVTALRAIPNLVVIRPADSNETAQAWRVALKRKDGPTALVLTRQAVPLITPVDNALEKGAYILADAPHSDKIKVILIATGSEVSLAMAAREQLNSQGVSTRVVSIPSWELFNKQPQEYCQTVLPSDIKARLAIEAGVTLAWSKYVGLQGCILGVDRFGASAPYKTLYANFGLTVEAIVKAALDIL